MTSDEEFGNVVLHCRVCGAAICRAAYSPFDWVHEDDEIILKGANVKSQTNYDHAATPKVIEVRLSENKRGWEATWLPRPRT